MTGHGPARQAMARVLALEVSLLEAEVDLMARLIAAGILPEGARRTPTARELRAGVRFAELDRIVTDAAALIARKADRVRTHVLDGLAEQLAGVAATDPWAAVEELRRLTDPTSGATLPGLRQLIDEVAADVKGDLIRTAHAGAAEALDEARRQGIPDTLIGDVALGDTVEAAAGAQAATVAQAPATRLLDVAAQAGARAATAAGATGYDVLGAALDGAEAASRAGQEDAARQAANVTHGLGRAAAQAALPAPSEVYASELLDRNTCGPCAAVDGRTYTDLAAGLVDYPGAGGYIGCDGGSRCRGTLVLVHGTEAPPTLNNPGHGPGAPGGPADRTPQGPSGVGRPDHIGPDGGLLPTPLDKGAAPPSDLGTPLDEAGRTVIPLDHLEAPVPDVVDVAARPELGDPAREFAEWEDHHLEQLLDDDAEPLERRMAAADELDQRQAGTLTQVVREEDLDAETLARYEEDRAAWEAAGGYAADAVLNVVRAKGGRRIDAVRQLWAEELEQSAMRAEAATNGQFIRRDRMTEYRLKYGDSAATLFEGPARVAYYYASPELRAYWDTLAAGRQTFAEFAIDYGVTDAKTLERARKAAEARDDAILRADESATGKAKRARQRAEQARRRGPLTPGERLARDQRRRDRILAAERKQAAELKRLQDPPLETPPPAPAPAPAPVVEPVAPEAPASLFTPQELADALSPARKRTKAAILGDLESTPAGRDLAASIKAFTETRGGVANLRKNVDKLLSGEGLSPAVEARTRAFLDAMDTYPTEEVPALFRGIAVRVEEDTAAWWDAFEAQFKPGSTIDLNASSFTSSERKAAEFERMIGGTRKASSNYTAVRFVLEGHTHALPVETLSKFKSEREWITGGEFEVVEFSPATKAQPYARVVIRQRKGLKP